MPFSYDTPRSVRTRRRWGARARRERSTWSKAGLPARTEVVETGVNGGKRRTFARGRGRFEHISFGSGRSECLLRRHRRLLLLVHLGVLVWPRATAAPVLAGELRTGHSGVNTRAFCTTYMWMRMRAARARFCAVPTSLLTLRFFFMGSSVGSLSGAACTSHTSKRSAAPIGIAAAVGMGSHTCKGATPSSEPPTCTVGPAAMLLQGASAIASIVLFVVLHTANALLLSAVAIVVGQIVALSSPRPQTRPRR